MGTECVALPFIIGLLVIGGLTLLRKLLRNPAPPTPPHQIPRPSNPTGTFKSSQTPTQSHTSSYPSDDSSSRSYRDPADEQARIDAWWEKEQSGKEKSDPDPLGFGDTIDGILGIGRWRKEDDDDDY